MTIPTLWTPDRIAEAKRLWAMNLSARSVGKKLGVSRNSIIGLMHRQRMAKRVRPPAEPKVRRTSSSKPRYPRNSQPKAKPMIEEPAIQPEARMLSLLDLQAHDCRWPIGDPHKPGFGFCGAKTEDDESYCRWHRGISYMPLESRVRRARPEYAPASKHGGEG